MDVATAMSVVQTILTAIQTLVQLAEICSISGCKRQLEDLQSTVETVKAVLEDADAKQDALNSQEKIYITELRDTIYDADDVIDEFVTLAKRKQIIEASDKFSDKVRSFLFRFTHITHNLCKKVKKVNANLDAIATKSSKFSFKVDNTVIRFKKEETSCFVSADDKIVGRDEDMEKIVDLLLSCDVNQPDVSFLSIVGMGGLGKTALAQLVYDDTSITSAFPIKSWTCIADQDPEGWNVKELLGKVLRDLQPKGNKYDSASLQQMQGEIRNVLGGKKYLLVLDDVWTEDYHRWQQLEEYLKLGQRGSRIVVTTQSNMTAQMVGGGLVHKLRGLSGEDAWSLFETMAFKPEQREIPSEDLIKIGKEIVTKCTDVPLAIRVVGSLLRGQPQSKWELFQEKGLAEIGQSDDTINNILKLSYHQLNSCLKSCFAYCAIFPIWMAQGYIDVEYFLMLLQRCFFQEVREDRHGEIYSFKIHDLMHDLAEQVSGEEICRFDSSTHHVGKRVRHVSLLCDSNPKEIFNMTHLRTYYLLGQLLLVKSIGNFTCLRTLDLHKFDGDSLPKLISKLLHLRYLDLSWSKNLEVLPESITKLVNLQTLDVSYCSSLRELPKDVARLVNLSTLDILGCLSLRHMHSSMKKLTCLQTLGLFVVGHSSSSGHQCFDGLEDLRSLNNLKGYLEIKIGVSENAKYVKEDHGGGAYLTNKKHLKNVYIRFEKGEQYGNMVAEQALLEEMQPHPNLRKLILLGYNGASMPVWLRGGNNLVYLRIVNCPELQFLHLQVGKLPHLKELQVRELPNLEYVVDANPEAPGLDEVTSLFPSLEIIYLSKLPKLKGWRPRSVSGVQNENLTMASSPRFDQLKRLKMRYCPRMTSIPASPCLELLELNSEDFFYEWRNMRRIPLDYQSLLPLTSERKILEIMDLERVNSLPPEFVKPCAAIVIRDEKKVESLAEVKPLLFQTCLLTSVRFLKFDCCPALRSFGGWLEKLSNLVILCIHDCPNLLLGGVPWQHLPRSFQSLELWNFWELEELPEQMQHCTSLQSLVIWDWPKLHSLPKWLRKLTSLERLQLRYCSPQLKERCQKPSGEDWPLIRHISLVSVRANESEESLSDDDNWVHQYDNNFK